MFYLKNVISKYAYYLNFSELRLLVRHIYAFYSTSLLEFFSAFSHVPFQILIKLFFQDF